MAPRAQRAWSGCTSHPITPTHTHAHPTRTRPGHPSYQHPISQINTLQALPPSPRHPQLRSHSLNSYTLVPSPRPQHLSLQTQSTPPATKPPTNEHPNQSQCSSSSSPSLSLPLRPPLLPRTSLTGKDPCDGCSAQQSKSLHLVLTCSSRQQNQRNLYPHPVRCPRLSCFPQCRFWRSLGCRHCRRSCSGMLTSALRLLRTPADYRRCRPCKSASSFIRVMG